MAGYGSETIDGTAKAVRSLLVDSAGIPGGVTFTGTVNSAPTFKLNPSDAAETAKFGKVDASGIVQTNLNNASVAVTGTFFQALQPVSASSLPLPSGAATAANQQTNALTDTQLRATAVPVSLASVPSHAVTNAGTFATQATLSAETTKVIGTVNQGTSPWAVSAGSLPLPTGASTSANQYIMRASEKTGRVHKDATIGGVAVTTTIYTVTGGKTFYLCSLIINHRNTSVTAGLLASLTDNATRKIHFQAGISIAGQTAPATFDSLSFVEPIPFSTNVVYELITGTPVASITISGYEE